MKVLFVEARSARKIKLNRKIINQLPDKISLVSAVQFTDQLKELKRQLEKTNRKVFVGKPCKHATECGQVLGCDVSAAKAVEKRIDCILYVGDGEFHPIGIALEVSKPVFRFNPFADELDEISNEIIRLYQKKRMIRKSSLKSAKKVGILISTKPGQHLIQGKLKDAEKKLKGKQIFRFICDTVNPDDLANFPGIDIWINTACPRLADDQESFKRPIINARDL